MPPTKATNRVGSERFGVVSVSLVKIVGNGRVFAIAKENLFSGESLVFLYTDCRESYK